VIVVTNLTFSVTLGRSLNHLVGAVEEGPLWASRAVQLETIDGTTDHGIVQPLTIRLLGFNFFGGRI
jgi:hypothetical protein